MLYHVIEHQASAVIVAWRRKIKARMVKMYLRVPITVHMALKGLSTWIKTLSILVTTNNVHQNTERHPVAICQFTPSILTTPSPQRLFKNVHIQSIFLTYSLTYYKRNAVNIPDVIGHVTCVILSAHVNLATTIYHEILTTAAGDFTNRYLLASLSHWVTEDFIW